MFEMGLRGSGSTSGCVRAQVWRTYYRRFDLPQEDYKPKLRCCCLTEKQSAPRHLNMIYGGVIVSGEAAQGLS